MLTTSYGVTKGNDLQEGHPAKKNVCRFQKFRFLDLNFFYEGVPWLVAYIWWYLIGVKESNSVFRNRYAQACVSKLKLH